MIHSEWKMRFQTEEICQAESFHTDKKYKVH